MESTEELLVIKKERDKIKVKVVDKSTNQWSPRKYEKIISNKDYNLLAYFLYDLYMMGYPIPKSYNKFREMLNDPELFFL